MSTSCLRWDTVLALRAPMGTSLEFPDSIEQSTLWLQTPCGHIELYAITLPTNLMVPESYSGKRSQNLILTRHFVYATQFARN